MYPDTAKLSNYHANSRWNTYFLIPLKLCFYQNSFVCAYLFSFLFDFGNKVSGSLCGCETPYVARVDPELLIFLSLLPKFWNSRLVALHMGCVLFLFFFNSSIILERKKFKTSFFSTLIFLEFKALHPQYRQILMYFSFSVQPWSP